MASGRDRVLGQTDARAGSCGFWSGIYGRGPAPDPPMTKKPIQKGCLGQFWYPVATPSIQAVVAATESCKNHWVFPKTTEMG